MNLSPSLTYSLFLQEIMNSGDELKIMNIKEKIVGEEHI